MTTLRDGKKSVRRSMRWEQLMYFDVPRWIHVFDNGGETIDRYMVVFHGLRQGVVPCLSMNSAPFHPQGFGQNGELSRNWNYHGTARFGKRRVFADLPLDCQWLTLVDYCNYWHLDFTTHPLYRSAVAGSWGVSRKDGIDLWRPARPFKGKFDSREWMHYFTERCATDPEVLIRGLRVAGFDAFPNYIDIKFWQDAERMEVAEYIARHDKMISENKPLTSLPIPAILQRYVDDQKGVEV